MIMFDREYSFRGTHAEKVIRLTSAFDKNHNSLLSRNLDVYLMAPIIGFLYRTKSDLDRGDKDSRDTKIFVEQLISEQRNLQFIYRLIILLDKDHEPNYDERINKAFRNYGSEKAQPDEALFDQYVRGGVDVLYERLIAHAKSEDDYVKNLYDFVAEFQERYNETICASCILDLCSLARS
jgi:hypothetical protein